jgi:hypothetical protein
LQFHGCIVAAAKLAPRRFSTVFAPFFIRLLTVFHRFNRFLKIGREDVPHAVGGAPVREQKIVMDRHPTRPLKRDTSNS